MSGVRLSDEVVVRQVEMLQLRAVERLLRRQHERSRGAVERSCGREKAAVIDLQRILGRPLCKGGLFVSVKFLITISSNEIPRISKSGENVCPVCRIAIPNTKGDRLASSGRFRR